MPVIGSQMAGGALTIPQCMHTIRGPNAGVGLPSDRRSAFSIASWWHSQHNTASDRTLRACCRESAVLELGKGWRTFLDIVRRCPDHVLCPFGHTLLHCDI
jgi:hypothetical protein